MFEHKTADMLEFVSLGQQRLYVYIRETTVVKEEARDEFFIEIKGADECSQVAQ